MLEICPRQTAIVSIDSRGFWLRCRDEDLYVPFALFPWFEHATVAQLCLVQCIGESCLYWPELDVELGLNRLRSQMVAAQYAGGVDC